MKKIALMLLGMMFAYNLTASSNGINPPTRDQVQEEHQRNGTGSGGGTRG